MHPTKNLTGDDLPPDKVTDCLVGLMLPNLGLRLRGGNPTLAGDSLDVPPEFLCRVVEGVKSISQGKESHFSFQFGSVNDVPVVWAFEVTQGRGFGRTPHSSSDASATVLRSQGVRWVSHDFGSAPDCCP